MEIVWQYNVGKMANWTKYKRLSLRCKNKMYTKPEMFNGICAYLFVTLYATFQRHKLYSFLHYICLTAIITLQMRFLHTRVVVFTYRTEQLLKYASMYIQLSNST